MAGIDVVTLALAKNFTKESLDGAGAVKGAPCEIESITPIAGGNRVTFSWTSTSGQKKTSDLNVMDGADGEDGKDGTDGADGDNGVGIKSLSVSTDNKLLVELDNGDVINAGTIKTIKGDTGDDGADGVSPTVSMKYVESPMAGVELTITDKDGDHVKVIPTGPVGPEGPKGDTGDDGFSPTIVEDPDNSDTVYRLDITDANGTIVTPNLKGSGGSGGVTDYNALNNRPQINGVTLSGNKTGADLGLASSSDIPSKTSELTNDSNFIVDANYSHIDNNYTTAEKDKLSDIEDNANNYSLPIASDSVLGGIKVGANLSIDSDGTLNAQGGGSGGTTDYAELSNKPQIAGVTLSGNKSLADLGIAASSDIPTATSDLTNDSNFVADASYVHTDSNYTATEKAKLAGIEDNANNYSLPAATGSTLGGVKVGSNLSVSADGTLSADTVVTSYSDLTNKPQIAGTTLEGNKTLADLGIAASADIPTNTSDLTNDSNFAVDASYVHTDNNYTTEEKTKLAGLSNYDDTQVTNDISNLQAIVPSGATSSNKLATSDDVTDSIGKINDTQWTSIENLLS